MSKDTRKKRVGRRASVPGTVEEFLATLEPAARRDVEAVRALILGADPGIEEGIKWNVPSFRTTEYFATVNMRSKAGPSVILHFGAKKRAVAIRDVAGLDPAGLLTWLAADRAIVTFRDLDDLAASERDFANLIRAWIRHV